MHIPKRYGENRIENCPFCNERGIALNRQGVPVCLKHMQEILENLKCVCGKQLDIKEGKFGVFFECFSCGTISLRKVLEINEVKSAEKEKITRSKEESIIRSDDPRYF